MFATLVVPHRRSSVKPRRIAARYSSLSRLRLSALMRRTHAVKLFGGEMALRIIE